MAYRANSVMELSTRDGQRTSAIYGVLNSIPHDVHTISKELNSNAGEIVVAWDYGKNKRRMKLYPDYKKGRKHDDTEEDKLWYKEFIEQTNILHGMLDSVGVKSLKVSGQEADDLIYSYIKVAEKERDYDKNHFVIISNDEDFLHLVSPTVSVYSPTKKVMHTMDSFQDDYGVTPEQFLSCKILKGDSSDHIPGIEGIGDVIGKKLVSKYGGIPGILANSNDESLRKSKVTNRIFTPEGLQILDRNNKMMNLPDYVDVEETKEEVVKLIASQPFVDDKAAREFLMSYQLSSIIVNFKEWIRLFKSVNSTYYES